MEPNTRGLHAYRLSRLAHCQRKAIPLASSLRDSGTDTGTDLTGSRSEVVQDCSSIVAQVSRNAIALAGLGLESVAAHLAPLCARPDRVNTRVSTRVIEASAGVSKRVIEASAG